VQLLTKGGRLVDDLSSLLHADHAEGGAGAQPAQFPAMTWTADAEIFQA
jgi:hypothetical protein